MKTRKPYSQDSFVSPLLLMLVVVFVSFLMMSNILANQMLSFGPWTIDAGTLTFPITYVLSDVFSEVYGYKWSRRVTWYATAMNLILALFIMAAIHLPQPEWYDGSHFQLAIGGSLRIVAASLISYFFGDFTNDRIFRLMKGKNKTTKGFSIRAIASSLGGSIVDSTLFVLIAFSFVIPANEMLPMILINVVIKTAYETAILPLTCLVVKKVKKQEEQYIQAVQGETEV
jgi:uncharacterized integral membrane protein (TIGR00697 family)